MKAFVPVSLSAQHQRLLQRLSDRLEAVTDRQLLLFSAAWVLGGGLVLQLVLLPYVFPQFHWGHGLILDQDSRGFHLYALENAEKIRTVGWSAWEWTPETSVIALASALYVLVWPEPWVVLPVNALLFAAAIWAVRRALAITFDSGAVGLAAVLPFFLYPSFVPIWGQLHRDVNTGAGFCLVLCGLVLAGHKGPRSASFWSALLVALTGTMLILLSRTHAAAVVAAGTVAYAVLVLPTPRVERLRVIIIAAVVVVAAASSISSWSTRFLFTTAPTPPVSASSPVPEAAAAPPASSGATATPAPPPAAESDWSSFQLPRLRRVDRQVRGMNYCLPAPADNIYDKLLYGLCWVREGFVVDSIRLHAASGYDFDVRLRTTGDFVAYGPRALTVALLEPGPGRWLRESTPIGTLGRYLVPFEMTVAYGCFVLAAVFGYRAFRRAEVWALVMFCLTYILFYVTATSQIGTLYRMRAFAFAILVSTALATVFASLNGSMNRSAPRSTAEARP